MAIDWEDILGAEGADLADAYDAVVADYMAWESRRGGQRQCCGCSDEDDD